MNEKNYTDEEQKIVDVAVIWAKKNKKIKARELTDKAKYSSDKDPVAFLMAGCPAAGKTEFAKAFAALIGENFNANGDVILRIDPDEIRECMPGYDGLNSSLFQFPTSIIVEKCFDFIMKNNQSFILDGTLSDASKAISNTGRCLKRGYELRVLYVYNSPLSAWEAARAREARDGRAITMDVFIDRYFKSKESVRILKQEFGHSVKIDLLLKDLREEKSSFKFNVDDIDNHIPEQYNRESLKNALLKSEE
jgi:UDP-N-acetylglucosamine kinase